MVIGYTIIHNRVLNMLNQDFVFVSFCILGYFSHLCITFRWRNIYPLSGANQLYNN